MSGLITGDGVLALAIADRLGDSLLIPNRIMEKGVANVLLSAESMLDSVGHFDYLINCYGFNYLSWIGDTPMDVGARIFEANVLLPYYIIDNLVKKGHKPIRVVNISSQTHKIPQRCTSLYCASKAALVHMTRVMARELGPKGWVINCVAPGKIVGTEMTRKTDQQVLELRGWTDSEADAYALGMIPARRFTSPEEVATVVNQVLDMPSYVNGACIDVTGGA